MPGWGNHPGAFGGNDDVMIQAIDGSPDITIWRNTTIEGNTNIEGNTSVNGYIKSTYSFTQANLTSNQTVSFNNLQDAVTRDCKRS